MTDRYFTFEMPRTPTGFETGSDGGSHLSVSTTGAVQGSTTTPTPAERAHPALPRRQGASANTGSANRRMQLPASALAAWQNLPAPSGTDALGAQQAYQQAAVDRDAVLDRLDNAVNRLDDAWRQHGPTLVRMGDAMSDQEGNIARLAIAKDAGRRVQCMDGGLAPERIPEDEDLENAHLLLDASTRLRQTFHDQQIGVHADEIDRLQRELAEHDATVDDMQWVARQGLRADGDGDDDGSSCSSCSEADEIEIR